MCVCVCIYASVDACGISQGCPPPPPRNVSRIATANQTECKSALWKELRKKELWGPLKNRYSFQPVYSPTSPEMGHGRSSSTRTAETRLLLLFFFSSNELQVFPPTEAQLYCSSWKLHHAQDEGIQRVSKVKKNCLIAPVCLSIISKQEQERGGEEATWAKHNEKKNTAVESTKSFKFLIEYPDDHVGLHSAGQYNSNIFQTK